MSIISKYKQERHFRLPYAEESNIRMILPFLPVVVVAAVVVVKADAVWLELSKGIILLVDEKPVELLLDTKDVDWEVVIVLLEDVLLELLDRSVAAEAVVMLLLML